MPRTLGAYPAYPAYPYDRLQAAALDVLAASGLPSVAVNTGGFLPSPHCPVDLLLVSVRARADHLARFGRRGGWSEIATRPAFAGFEPRERSACRGHQVARPS